MSYKNILKLFLLPLFLLFVVIACEEDEDLAGKYSKPTMTALSQQLGFVGDEVTISGTGLKDVIRVDFGSVSAANFNPSNNTDEAITVTVPEGLEEGEIFVAVYYKGNADNNLGPMSNLPFIVVVGPSITSTSPAEAKPTRDIQILGSHLATTTAVRFGNLNVPFTQEGGVLTVTVPDVAPGITPITVDTKGGSASYNFNVLGKTAEITSFDPVEAKPNNTVTVTGVFFETISDVRIGDKSATSFEQISDTEVTFVIAPGSQSGKIVVVNQYGEGASKETFNVIQTLALPYAIVDEGLNAGWQLWGWGNTTTLESTEQALVGTMSAKVVYSDAWGGFQMHPADPDPFDMSSVTKISVSIYGGAGSDGKKVALYIKKDDGLTTPNIQLTIVEGQWTTFEIPMSDLESPPNIEELVFQAQDANGLEMYVDDFKLL